MDWCESIANRKIREAIEAGAFDDLPDKGKPIRIESNPFEDPSEWMAHHLLRVNGFAPPWMEDSKEIEQNLARLRADLKNARPGSVQAVEQFRERARELNRRILTYNLKCPSTHFHLRTLDIETEIGHAAQPHS